MKEIITQAPIQSRPDTVDKHERMFPLLVAEAVNRVEEYDSGCLKLRVDTWNTVGSKIDLFYRLNGGGLETRYEYNSAQIEKRYELLEKIYGIDRSVRIVLRDDNQDYEAIVDRRIGQLLEKGILSVKQETFVACQECDRVIAPKAVEVKRCPECKGCKFDLVDKRGLFLSLDSDMRQGLIKDLNVSPTSSLARLRSDIHNLPDLIQLSKQRDYGLNLEKYGVDADFVLDPKISLALFSLVVEELGLGQVTTVIQGVDSLGNTVPFTEILNDHNPNYIGVSLIPKYTEEEVNRYGSSFYFPFLALSMLSQRNNLTPGQLQALSQEFQKTKRKYSSCLKVLSGLEVTEGINPSFDLSVFRQVFDCLGNHQTREAVLILRGFIYDELSKKYVKQCKLQGRVPDKSFLADLSDLFKLIYGENE